ncbi:MAG: hypothetical protein LC804_26230 [Acidobacteria bacterium]|nr:hypothetical protein [Acidobacteriota bacterium]
MLSVRPLTLQEGRIQTAEFVMTKGPFLNATLWLVVALVCPVAQLAAQDKPDFSGSWVLESGAQAAGDIPQALSVSQVLVRTNVRGEPMKPFYKDITVTRVLESGTRSETYQIGIMGGTVAGQAADGTATGPRTHHRVAWMEQSLVIESGSHTGPAPASGQWTPLARPDSTKHR